MAYEVVEKFEEKAKPSKYLPLSDGRSYKVPVSEFGHKSTKNLSMALRSFAKRKHKKAKIQTGEDDVIVKMEPEF